MSFDSEKHHRRSIQLPDYDYRQPGGYFVMVCVQDHVCLFGEVVEGRMQLNDCGRVAAEEWHRTAEVRDYVELDASVVMPNHVHGIIGIVDGAGRGTPPVCPYDDGTRRFGHAVAGSLPTIMRQYESMVTKRINRLWETSGESIWQRGYYEHVLRGRRDLERIRRYIEENPTRWGRDRYYMH